MLLRQFKTIKYELWCIIIITNTSIACSVFYQVLLFYESHYCDLFILSTSYRKLGFIKMSVYSLISNAQVVFTLRNSKFVNHSMLQQSLKMSTNSVFSPRIPFTSDFFFRQVGKKTQLSFWSMNFSVLFNCSAFHFKNIVFTPLSLCNSILTLLYT